MSYKPNILVVCGRNKRRSRTAEHLFKNDDRFHIRSAGLSPQSDRKISETDLQWADTIFVMEPEHRRKLSALYPQFGLSRVEVLDIADEYEFMEEELVETLQVKVNEYLKIRFGA